jgi:hypothetical protein
MAIFHTFLAGNENLTLRFDLAIFYTTLNNFFINNIYAGLTLAGGLRLISLICNSEAAGLHLFGPDNEAILKIRLFFIILSFAFPCFVVNVLGAYPGLFGLFYREESQSNWEDIKNNVYTSLFLLLPFITVIVNISVVMYSHWIKRQMKQCASVFIIFEDHFETVNSSKFSFSILQATAFPVLTFTSVLQSFCDRKQRLFFLSLLHIFLCAVFLPVCIIFNNPKIKDYFVDKYLFHCTRMSLISFYQKYSSKKIQPKIIDE